MRPFVLILMLTLGGWVQAATLSFEGIDGVQLCDSLSSPSYQQRIVKSDADQQSDSSLTEVIAASGMSVRIDHVAEGNPRRILAITSHDDSHKTASGLGPGVMISEFLKHAKKNKALFLKQTGDQSPIRFVLKSEQRSISFVLSEEASKVLSRGLRLGEGLYPLHSLRELKQLLYQLRRNKRIESVTLRAGQCAVKESSTKVIAVLEERNNSKNHQAITSALVSATGASLPTETSVQALELETAPSAQCQDFDRWGFNKVSRENDAIHFGRLVSCDFEQTGLNLDKELERLAVENDALHLSATRLILSNCKAPRDYPPGYFETEFANLFLLPRINKFKRCKLN